MNSKPYVVVLAAGKGTRMKSDLPKVLHPLCGRPMLEYSLDLADNLGATKTIAVIGHKAEMVKEAMGHREGLEYALQEPQLGTGHAIICAEENLFGHDGPVLVLYGDVPGLHLETLSSLLETHAAQSNAMTVLSMDLDDPAHYGRLVMDGDKLLRIVEYRDATENERRITLANTGIYVFDCRALLAGLSSLNTDNDQKEYYLTDMVEILNSQGLGVGHSLCPDPDEVQGINSKDELAHMEARLSGGA